MPTLPRKFGAHMSIAGGCHNAVLAAHHAGMRTVQLFTKSNTRWHARPLTADDVAAFKNALHETGIVDPISHVSYLINLASPDDALWRKSIDAMTVEVERACAFGIADVVVHPGAHMGRGEPAGLRRAARAIDQIHRRLPGATARIDLESTAGQGTCLGHRFSHLAAILDRVQEPERLGVCLDSCHLFAAGYAMANADVYNQMIDDLQRAVGIARVRVWHLNDSLKPCGSRVDRHAGIGKGEMGLFPFRAILNDPRFADLPMILETPKGTENGIDLDLLNLRALRRLVRPQTLPSTRPGRRRKEPVR